MIVACSVDCYNSINKGSSLRLLLKFQKKHLPSYGEKETLCALLVVLLLGRIIQSCCCIATHRIDVSFGNLLLVLSLSYIHITPCVYVLCSTGTVVGCNLSQYIVCVLVIPWSRPAGQSSNSIPYTLIEHFNRSRIVLICTVVICRVELLLLLLFKADVVAVVHPSRSHWCRVGCMPLTPLIGMLLR
jgi:hypothetical protein